MSAVKIDDLPNEILCNILDFLDTPNKFKTRLVCSRWKGQVDENVSFHAVIADQNYELVRKRFGTSRRVTSIWIYDYSRTNIPIHNLSFVRLLTVRSQVNRLAVKDILSKATSLNTLKIDVDHAEEDDKYERTPGSPILPALQSIKNLHIGYLHRIYSRTWNQSQMAWHPLLNEEMPNVQFLMLELWPDFPQLHGFEFFKLAAGMQKLQKFIMFISSSNRGRGNAVALPGGREVAINVQMLTPAICEGLRKLDLTQVTASVSGRHENAWNALFSDQRQLKKLCLSIDSKQGLPLSMIQPVLQKSSKCLQSIVLDIDTKINGDVNMEMFSQLKTLRELKLKAWLNNEGGERNVLEIPHSHLTSIHNCSSVVIETLENLSIVGFKFTEEDVIGVIKKVPKGKLDRVDIGSEFASRWKRFEEQLNEMGIVQYGHSAQNPSKHRSTALNSGKIYLGNEMEVQHDYEYFGPLNQDLSRKVKDVTVGTQSLVLETHGVWIPG